MNKTQRGFSAVEGLLVLVVFGFIGVVGFVINNKNENKNTKNGSTNQHVEIPSSWQVYSHSDLRFKFAYPGSWDKLVHDKNYPGDIFRATAQASDSVNDFTGELEFLVFPDKKSYSIQFDDPGPLLKPVLSGNYIGKWVVAAPDTSGGYSNLKAKDDAKISPDIINNLRVYNFTYTGDFGYAEGGCTVGRWVIDLKDKLIEISLPRSCIDLNIDSASDVRKNAELYNNLVTKFTNTFSVY